MRLFTFLTVLLFLTLMGCSRNVKEYTFNIDAFNDNATKTILDSKGKPINGLLKYYYKGLLTEAFYNNGKRNGLQRTYYENGEIYLEYNYKDGKKEGFYRRYHKNGKLGWEMPYENDKAEGIRREYYEEGSIKADTPYVNGKREGIGKRYYGSGEIMTETPYRNDRPSGISISYRKNGEINEEMPFKDWGRDGLAKFYFLNGAVLKVQYSNNVAKSAVCVSASGTRIPIGDNELTKLNIGIHVECDRF